MNESAKSINFLPSLQRRHVVFANKIKQLGCWKSLLHQTRRIHRKRWAFALDLAAIPVKSRLILDGSLQHFATEVRRRWRAFQLVRRDVCGNENHPLQAKRLHGVTRHNEMSMVHGIEAPAEQSDFL